LIFVDGYLYEGTGQKGRSSISKIDLEKGEVLLKTSLNRRYFGEGITIFRDKIFQLTWRSNIGFVYDKNTFSRLNTFYYSGEGWGITHDKEHLIMSDGSSEIKFVNSDNLKIVRKIQVTENQSLLKNINELEYINGEILANVWYSDYIYKINPDSGKVVGKIDLSGLYPKQNRSHRDAVLNGIAFDKEKNRLFVTGKLWPNLFEIELVSSL